MQGHTGGTRVLVLEDEAIIAMDIETSLGEGGLTVVATLARCSSAMEWLEGNDADVAILDLNLLDGSCQPVAARLNERGIPFVIFSGSSRDTATVDEVFLGGGWLEKPAPSDKIVAAVRAAASLTRAET